MWDLPGPGLEPMSPALAGGFLTTAPPEKSPGLFFLGGTCGSESLEPTLKSDFAVSALTLV